jgi:predicted RNA polymerase sigma factor
VTTRNSDFGESVLVGVDSGATARGGVSDLTSHHKEQHHEVALARIVRREAGLIVAQLLRRLGNFDVAEEAVQEAIIIALRTWRRDGVPANPGGVDQIADRLSGHHLLHATRAQLLTALRDHAAGRAANERALALTHNPAEQQLLRARLGSDLLN